MKATIGGRVFHATLEDNETARAFLAMLPLKLKMADFNRNEKMHRFGKKMPTRDAKPGAIRTGDLMVWSSDTLVLFYESFATPYAYTRLGKLDDPAGLRETAGSGEVEVTFEKSP